MLTLMVMLIMRKEITYKGLIRVETETETLFKADGVTPEDAPVSTRTHYFKADAFHTHTTSEVSPWWY